MAEYNDAPRVRDMAESLIGKHHAHLKDARIAYVMKEGEVGKKITENLLNVSANTRYLPLKSRRKEDPDLSKYSGLSESTLRKLIKRGELRHFRATARGKILVHTTWFDELAEARERQNRLIPDQVRAFGEEVLAG